MTKTKPNPKATSKDELRTEALRERILRGASQAFARLGFSDTRVEDIAAETGISRPTFYKVFDSKDAAFFALSDHHHNGIRKRLTQAYESTDNPIEQLTRTVESFLRWRAELGPFGRVLDVNARSHNTPLAPHRSGTLRHVVELITVGLAQAKRPPVDPVLLRALVAASEHVADELFSELPVSERAFQRARELVLRIVFAALAQAGDPVPPLPEPPEKPRKPRKH